MKQIHRDFFAEDCWMLDVETTGLDYKQNCVTSFALVQFDLTQSRLGEMIKQYRHYRIGSNILKDLNCVWNESTFVSRQVSAVGKQEKMLPSINCRAELNGIFNTIDSDIDHRNLFAWHTEFDIPFMNRIAHSLGTALPFKHNKVWECNSLILGNGVGPAELKRLVQQNETLQLINKRYWQFKTFEPHNALYDCIEQIFMLESVFNF